MWVVRASAGSVVRSASKMKSSSKVVCSADADSPEQCSNKLAPSIFGMKFGRRTIGIIGGMGPGATADLYIKIVREFQTRLNAKYDKDFPPMVIMSVPIPDHVEKTEDIDKARDILIEAAQTAEKAGADLISIPCNTAHYAWSDIQSAVSIPVLNMIQETARYLKEKDLQRVGLLATQATVNFGLYQKELRALGIRTILPDEAEMRLVTQSIVDVMAGRARDQTKRRLEVVMKRLLKKGAQVIVLGCTELPLILSNDDPNVIDPTSILARRCFNAIIATAQ